MSVELSPRTEELRDRLYAPSESLSVKQQLSEHVSESVSFPDPTPARLERVRFALLKLAHSGRELESVIELAKIGWRDLLVSAGFEDKLDAHMAWYARVIKPEAD